MASISHYYTLYGRAARHYEEARQAYDHLEDPRMLSVGAKRAQRCRLVSLKAGLFSTGWAVATLPWAALKTCAWLSNCPTPKGVVQAVLGVGLLTTKAVVQLVAGLGGALAPGLTYGLCRADRIVLLLGVLRRLEFTKLPDPLRAGLFHEQRTRWRVAKLITDRIVREFHTAPDVGPHFHECFAAAVAALRPSAGTQTAGGGTSGGTTR